MIIIIISIIIIIISIIIIITIIITVQGVRGKMQQEDETCYE
jgi:hypothetical protein